MPFITTKEYEKSFAEERTKLKNELKSTTGKNPKALDKYKAPVDTTKSIGTILVIILVAGGINLVLSLILAAIMDGIFPNYDTMPTAQKDTITTIIWLSMLILPVIALVYCILHNSKVNAELKKYKALQETQEYKDAVRKQNEYQAKESAAKKKLDEFDAKTDPDRSMGVIYVAGGAPADGSYMGDLCIDDSENQMRISYNYAPYEFFIPQGTYDIMIKRRNKIVWKEIFYFNADKVYTIDIAGAADSIELSGDLDRYSSSGRSDIRYQAITKSQYKKARAGLDKKPVSYVMQ